MRKSVVTHVALGLRIVRAEALNAVRNLRINVLLLRNILRLVHNRRLIINRRGWRSVVNRRRPNHSAYNSTGNPTNDPTEYRRARIKATVAMMSPLSIGRRRN